MPALLKRKKLAPVAAQKTRRALVIAHNHPQFFPGGAEIFAHDLFKALRVHTHYAPSFMAAANRASHNGTAFMAANDSADEFIFSGEAYDYFYHSQRRANLMFDDFRTLLKNLRPHVIHFHHTMRVGLEALRIARDTLPGVKIIYTLHEFILMCHRDGQMLKTDSNALCDKASPAACHACFPQFSSAQFMMRETFIKAHLELVDQFIAPSEFLVSRFVEWGIPREKIRVMENGRHLAAAAPHRVLPKGGMRNRFAYFGQINPYKGTLLMLKAAQRLAASGFTNFHIDIFGSVEIQSDAFKQEFFALLKETATHVTFHGKYDNHDMGKLIAGADWVITPSLWWENSPLVIQEALMHRRPVICSNIGGMKEKVADGKTGLHFNVGDEASLAAILQRAATEKTLWPSLIKNITPRLSIEQSARDHAALYDAS